MASMNRLHFKGPFNITSFHSAHPLLDETSGVYVIWYEKTEGYIYVGEVSRQPAKKRLMQHWTKSHNRVLRDWVQSFGHSLNFCFMPCLPGREKHYEQKLIDLLDPEANIRR